MQFSSASQRDRVRRENSKATATLKANYELSTPREQEILGLVTAGLIGKAGRRPNRGQRDHSESSSRQRYAKDGREVPGRARADGRCVGHSMLRLMTSIHKYNIRYQFVTQSFPLYNFAQRQTTVSSCR